jgi:1,4-dihydroxy-2-naphthoyl-CoA hydrolase
MESVDPIKTGSNFDVLLGTEWISLAPEGARARIEMRDELRQPYGILHGGVYSTLVESLCSYATANAVWPDGMIALGQSVAVSFLRPVETGFIDARAIARHRGRTTWVWECDVLDDAERLCAVGKMTMAIRRAPTSTPEP